MAQFSVYKNKNPKTTAAYPYLVDVQSNLLRDLRTLVVVPLVKLTALGKKPIKNLTPVLDVDGQKFIMLVPQLAGISLDDLDLRSRLPPNTDTTSSRLLIFL